MNWVRVKWLLIGLLLLGNLLLTGLYWQRHAESRRDADAFQNALLAVLADREVTLSPETEARLFTGARRLYAPRDTAAEEELAAALLGQVTHNDLGGRIYEYTGAAGWARFRFGDRFKVEWTTPRQVEIPPEADAVRILQSAGFPAGVPPEVRQTPTGVEVALFQFVDDLPIFDADVRLVYDQNALVSLSGQWLWGHPLPDEGELPCPVLGVSLLRFADLQRGAGTPVHDIREARLGYKYSVIPPEYICLDPVWQINADGRIYYIYAETGAPVL